jgi:hypothetical protein
MQQRTYKNASRARQHGTFRSNAKKEDPPGVEARQVCFLIAWFPV